MKIYLDNVLVSNIVRRDQKPPEVRAMEVILARRDAGALEVVTSAVAKAEIDKCTGPHRDAIAAVYEGLQRVPFVDAQQLLGFNVQDLGALGFLSGPRIQDDPVWNQLRNLGLDNNDAHHVMVAERSACDVFLTCDDRTILKRRAAVHAVLPRIQLMTPSELVKQAGW